MESRLVLVVAICVVKVTGETPIGHMKPLGSHKPPNVIIDEFTKDNFPRPPEFYEKYVKHSKAVIFRGGIEDSKAFKLWTDDYVRENFGDMEVRLEAKHEKKHMPPVGEKYLGRDSLRHFVDKYHSPGNNVYVVSDLPSSMYADMEVLPSLGACGEMGKSIVEVNIWWSGGGSASIIHKDAYHQMNCLLNGTKYWKLIEYKYEKDIHKHPEPERELGGFSDVNPQQVDLVRFPNFQKIEWSNITINAGDCLYLPKSYYHQVDSEGTHNMAVSLLFARFDRKNSLDFSDCNEDTDYKTSRSLADYDVQLVWPGKGNMVMGRSDLEDGYRQMLLQLTEETKRRNIRIDADKFIDFLEEEQEGIMFRMGDARKAFEILDRNSDGELTTEDIKGLTLDELRKVSNEIEPWEPSNSYEFEYSVVSFENVWWLIQRSLKSFRVLEKRIWLKYYQRLGGSEMFGTEVFDRLGGGKPKIVCKDIDKKQIWYALENWQKYWAPQYSSLTEKPTMEEEGQLWAWSRGEGDFAPEEDSMGERDEERNIDMSSESDSESFGERHMPDEL